MANVVQFEMTVSEAFAQATQLQLAGDLPRADQLCRQVLSADPMHAESWNLLGVIAQQTGNSSAAVECIRRAIGIHDNVPAYFSNLGTVYKSLGRLDEATEQMQHAVKLAPQLSMLHFNLGTVWQDRQRLDEAIACYEQTLAIDPDHLQARNNLGNLLAQLGRLDEAVDHYDRCLHLDPKSVFTRWNRAVAWLRMGNYAQGWPEYEWRFQLDEMIQQQFEVPVWDGSPLHGRTILLHVEQGLGDTLQMVRFASEAKRRGGRVVLACQRPLVRLLQSCPDIDQVVSADEPLPLFQTHASLLSLPRILGITLDDLPMKMPYLFAQSQLEEQWRHELNGMPGFKIGVVWQGSPHYFDDHIRSFRLSEYLPIAQIPGVRLISLQKGFGSEQLTESPRPFEILDLGSRLDETTGPFLDTAAVMRQLDLVIAPDTVIAHLAGGLGVPVWTAVSATPDWRWLVRREDCPWYPTMRVFQQSRLGDWSEVFQRMARKIQRLMKA